MDEFKNSDELQHHGIKGMKWGVRRFQNKDGSLTPRGEKRAAALAAKQTRENLKDKQAARRLTIEKAKKQMKEDSLDRENARKNATRESKAKAAAEKSKAKQVNDEDMYDLPDESAESAKRREQGKKLLMGAVAVVGTVATIYAIKKIREKSGKSGTADDGPEKAVDEALSKIKADKAAAKAAAKANRAATKATKDAVKAAARANKEAAKAREKSYKDIANRINKRPTKKEYSKLFDQDALNARYGTIADKRAQQSLKERMIVDRVFKERGMTSSAVQASAASGKSVVTDLFKKLVSSS